MNLTYPEAHIAAGWLYAGNAIHDLGNINVTTRHTHFSAL